MMHYLLTYYQVFFVIEDESSNHRRPGVETHFKITLVSRQFETLSRINRHRLVNRLAADEFDTGLHALSLNLYTPGEWEKRGHAAPDTPPCQHKKTKAE